MQQEQGQDSDQAERFMKELFGDPILKNEDLCIVVWSTPTKKAYFHLDSKKASIRALGLSGANENVYVCMGLQAKSGHKRKGRGLAKHTEAITCLWADIDFSFGEIHKKPNLPPTEKDALELAGEISLKPSVVVHSGHGLQCYWLLSNPWMLTDEAERNHAADVAYGWVNSLQQIAAARGWMIDSVGDLARVLRVPGTTNLKDPGEPLPVKILYDESNWSRYSLGDLRSKIMAPDKNVYPKKADRKALKAKLRTPGEDRKQEIQGFINILCINDSRFKETWHRNRTDLKDRSASGYDMSIASQLSIAGCDEQTIVDALYMWREGYNESPEKILREDYITLTLARARAESSFKSSLQKIDLIASKVKEEKLSPEEFLRHRQEAVNQISHMLNIEIDGLIQLGKENSSFQLCLRDGRTIYLGTGREAMSQEHVRVQIATVCHAVIRRLKRAEWDQVLQTLLQFSDVKEQPDLERKPQITSWLVRYLEDAPSIKAEKDEGGEEKKSALIGSRPFVENGHAYVNVTNFVEFLYQHKDARDLGRNRLADMMFLMGAQKQEFQLRIRGRPMKRRYWKIPLPKDSAQ